MRAISIATLVVLFVGCRSAEQKPNAASTVPLTTPPAVANPFPRLDIPMRDGVPDLSKVTLKLSRSECFGWCPEYEVTLHGSGTCVYVGKSFVIEKGPIDSSFSPADLLPVLQDLEALDFMNLKHKCALIVFDAPVATTSVSIGDRTASFSSALTGSMIADDQGAEAELHKRYVVITAAIDRLANDEQWLGTSEQRRSMMGSGGR